MFEILTLTGFELWASGAVNTRSANCLEKCNIGKLVGALLAEQSLQTPVANLIK